MRYVNVNNFNDAVVQLKIFPKSLFAASVWMWSNPFWKEPYKRMPEHKVCLQVSYFFDKFGN